MPNQGRLKVLSVLDSLEIPYSGNECGVMDKSGKTGRLYSAEEKATTLRMVRTVRA